MPIETSIIVPTYKECSNLEPLTERIFKALKSNSLDKSTEVIIMDDNSNDGSEETVNKLASKGYNVRIIVRKTERGLSSAVLAGFIAATATTNLICMDADLQHPYNPPNTQSRESSEFDWSIENGRLCNWYSICGG